MFGGRGGREDGLGDLDGEERMGFGDGEVVGGRGGGMDGFRDGVVVCRCHADAPCHAPALF